MKIMKPFYLLTLAALSLAACSKDEEADTPRALAIEQTEYTLDALENRTATLRFTASADWTLTLTDNSAEWLTVSPTSGTAGSQTIELAARMNLGETERSACLEIAIAEQTVQVTVTQRMTDRTDVTDLFDPVLAENLEREGVISDAGRITREELLEIAATTELSISGINAQSELRGIEYFESLHFLELSDATLPELALRNNRTLTGLDCSRNELTSLDISGCSALEGLDCSGNGLTSLDVSGCSALKSLYCENNRLPALNISDCTALQHLFCSSNHLTSLNVRHSPELTLLYCYYNQLPALDVTHCTKLQQLDCADNSLTVLDISHNPALTMLYCDSNLLTELDISKNRELTELQCHSNPGVGLATFPVMAWFDNETRPESLVIHSTVWVYRSTWEITIDFRKAE